MGSRGSALTGISRLFSSDDGGAFKQLKLTGLRQPGPLCPATLGRDDRTVRLLEQLLPQCYTQNMFTRFSL